MWPWTSAWIQKLQLTPTGCGLSSTIRPPAWSSRRYCSLTCAALPTSSIKHSELTVECVDVWWSSVFPNNAHMVLRLILPELMIRVITPCNHWLSPVPHERVVFFFCFFKKCKSWTALLGRRPRCLESCYSKKGKMWGICTAQCFPAVPVGIVLSLLICTASGRWLVPELRAQKTARYFRAGDLPIWSKSLGSLPVFSPLAASRVGSTCGHPLSCGAASTMWEFTGLGH